jgi:putative ABC transport system substrate-binding protein
MDMRRREFLGVLGCTAVAWPLAARAQQSERLRRVGLLWSVAPSDPEWQRRTTPFARGLQELGWVEGKNIAFEISSAGGDSDQLRALVQANVEVIVVTSAGQAALAKQLTNTIPIVTASAGDLEGTGLIASVRKPGGNVTGLQILSPELMSKRLDLLRQLVPNLTRLGIVVPVTLAGIVTDHYFEVITDTASALGMQIHRVSANGPGQFAPGFDALARDGVQAALVISNPLSSANRNEIVSSAARTRLPTIYELRFFVTSGGLVSYGAEIASLYREAATYVDQILKGAKANDLPVQQARKFELAINMKAAKALGLSVPSTLLTFADEVIE